MSATAGYGGHLGYWGFPCPNGTRKHLVSVSVSCDFEKFVFEDLPFPPDTKVKACPDCQRANPGRGETA